MAEFKNFPGVTPDGNPIQLTIAAGPVIIEDNKVLLDKHGDDGFWKFPGGRLRDDNSPQENAIMEAKEELGIDVELKGEPFVLIFEKDDEGVKEYVVLIHYLATRQGEINPGSDIKEWKWIDINNLPQDCAPNIALVVQHFTK